MRVCAIVSALGVGVWRRTAVEARAVNASEPSGERFEAIVSSIFLSLGCVVVYSMSASASVMAGTAVRTLSSYLTQLFQRSRL